MVALSWVEPAVNQPALLVGADASQGSELRPLVHMGIRGGRITCGTYGRKGAAGDVGRKLMVAQRGPSTATAIVNGE